MSSRPAARVSRICSAALEPRRPGLRALIAKSEVRGGKPKASDVGFRLAPRLNAAGRLGEAELAGRMAERMLEEGIYVIGFSFPVVPRGADAVVGVGGGAAIDHGARSLDALCDPPVQALVDGRGEERRDPLLRGLEVLVHDLEEGVGPCEVRLVRLPGPQSLTRFSIIDMVVDRPNVQSIVFKEHEGSFIVGVLAVMASKSGKVGFVGGMDIPLIRRFACGYAQGAKYINPSIEVFQNMTGTTPAAVTTPSARSSSWS